MVRQVATGVGAGLLAGAAVGLAEALVVLTHAALPPETAALAVGPALYGVLGALLGALAGGLLALPMRGAAPQAFFSVVALLVGDLLVVLLESEGRSLPGEHPMAWASVVVVLVVLDLLVLVLLPIFLVRSPLRAVLRLRGAVGLYLGGVGMATVFSLLPGGTSPGTLSPGREEPPGLRLRPDLVVLAVEGLRTDALDPRVMPQVAARMEGAVAWTEAFTASPWTRPAMASLLSSLPATAHTVVEADAPLPDEAVTLPEVLAEQGYVTAALANGLHVSRSANMQQGFDWFAWMPVRAHAWARESVLGLRLVHALRRVALRWGFLSVEDASVALQADGVLAAARDVIEDVGGSRWFLLVHLADLREPWVHTPPGVPPVSRALDPWPDPSRIPEARAAYEGEAGWLDQEIAGFLDWLDERGLRRSTAVLLVGLHGVSLGEHGAWWSGTTLYDAELHVPLVLWLPDGTGARRGGQVRLIDVAPTLARLAGAPLPPEWLGQPLDWEGPEPADRLVYAETDLPGDTLSAVRINGWKYIRSHGGDAELYHVGEDPGELADLAGRAGPVQADLDQLLRRAQEQAARASLRASTADLFDPATRERLRALGYVE